MDRTKLNSKTRRELVAIARDFDVRGRTTMRKRELVAALVAAGDGASNTPPPPRKAKPEIKAKPRKTNTAKVIAAATPTASPAPSSHTATAPTPFKPARPIIPPPDLPRGYGDNTVVLMTRDPRWIYTYWEIQAWKVREAEKTLGDAFASARWVMRVYDVTEIKFDGTNAHSSFDVELTASADNWYLQVPEAGRDYLSEIGMLARDGRFFMLARSNAVSTPRSSISEVVDEAWMSREREFERIYAISGGCDPVSGSASLGLREIMERRLRAMLFSPGVSSFGGSELR